jgi:hypothetical protein
METTRQERRSRRAGAEMLAGPEVRQGLINEPASETAE